LPVRHHTPSDGGDQWHRNFHFARGIRSIVVAHFSNQDGTWKNSPALAGLAKRHGLQGPIDDAFMDSFLVVRPTGKPLAERVGRWVQAELAHATNEWRRQFRGKRGSRMTSMLPMPMSPRII